MRYRDGRRSLCLSSQSGCPLTCTFCATGAMRFGRNLTASRDPRPGAPLPAVGSRRPRRLHGHGRAVPELRRGARLRAAAPRPRDHAPPDDDLDRRLDARADAASSTRSTSRSGSRSRSTPPIRRCARELMPVNDRYPLADVLAECRRYVDAAPPEGLRRVRHARRRQRLRRPTRGPRRAPRRAGLQGQPDPLQPDRAVRGLVARGDRARSRACSTGPGSRRPSGSRAAATSRPPAASWRRRRVPGAGAGPSSSWTPPTTRGWSGIVEGSPGRAWMGDEARSG